MNPVGLSVENCTQNLQVDVDNVYINQEVVKNQLETAFINVINSFLTKYDSNFLGKIYNMTDCPPGFEGPLCTPCQFGYFKPFYGSRECVACPCTVHPARQVSSEQRIYMDFSDCECEVVNWGKRNFGAVLVFIFGMVGLVVFVTLEIFKKFNSVEVMTLEVGDISDFLFPINVFGDNDMSSPLRIVEDFDEHFLEVSR